MNNKKVVAAIGSAGVLGATVLGVAGASALGSGAAVQASAPPAAATLAAASAGTGSGSSGTSGQSSALRGRGWLRNHRAQVRRAVVSISASTIHITPSALVTALRSGESIAEVAGDHGVAAQTVVNALVSAGDARVNQAVTNHKLTSAQAARIESKLPTVATRIVDHVFGHRTGGSSGTSPNAAPATSATTA